MRFVLLSHHTNGAEIPAEAAEQNMKDLGAWLSEMHATLGIPIRGGKSVTAKGTTDYAGELGGVIVFEADNLEHAVALARKSPGLKFGFTHEVFPEINLAEAAGKPVRND